VSTASSLRSGVKIDDAQAIFTNVTLASLIQRGYGVKAYQIDGPDWLSSRRYDVAARMPSGATTEQVSGMLQALLNERFHLTLHHDTRALNGYELIVGRAGLKLQPAGGSAPELTLMEEAKGGAVISVVTARAQRLSELANLVSREFRLPVADKTGETDAFDFRLEFAPQAPGALPIEQADTAGAPNLITAVQQLGLRLNNAKVATDILVIEHADQIPTEN
jgi:uncharacterized protein (TIGR03435 family)